MQKTDERIINLMIEKIDRLIEVYKNHSREEIETNFVYSDTIQYEFEKLYEDTTKLSFLFRVDNPYLNIEKLRGIRNRVAHDYESVIIDILLDAIEKDLPELKSKLLSALDSNNK